MAYNRNTPAAERPLHSAHRIMKTMADTWERTPHGSSVSQRSFITISRQAGIDAGALAHHMAAELGGDWSAIDDGLIEKVAADAGVSQRAIARIEDQRHTWLDDLAYSFSPNVNRDSPDEAKVYKRIVITVRALAEAGHVILVGKGSRFITAGMPGGRHVRLVASMSHRIAALAHKLDVSAEEAAGRLTEIDAARADFYRRHWPGKSLAPENFDLTLNVDEMSKEQMTQCILPILRAKPVMMSTVASVR